ncbi:hypothetical protein C8T65DRAFT_832752 [Cerioporus squamosus]|nr:hypothetical protein C8T65DRAFT_832752 [Cerioporus squamosus]
MSSSRSSSASPEPELVAKKAKKPKDKQKKGQAAADVGEHGRNEGDDHDLAYKPPEGFVLMKHKNEEGDFDWDAINGDDNLELWVVRVPDGLKPKHLEGLKIEASASSSTSRVGSAERKHTTYDVWSLGEDETEAVGGDELRAVSCLLPRRKKDGKLYQAPKPIARRLVISARPTIPTPPQSSPGSSPVLHQNPARPRHPKELLTHRFMPLGSLAPVDDSAAMDVDPVPAEESPSKTPKPRKDAEGADGSKKKRKGDVGSPKKKKVKTTS